jgi:hypothetical protein
MDGSGFAGVPSSDVDCGGLRECVQFWRRRRSFPTGVGSRSAAKLFAGGADGSATPSAWTRASALAKGRRPLVS